MYFKMLNSLIELNECIQRKTICKCSISILDGSIVFQKNVFTVFLSSDYGKGVTN